MGDKPLADKWASRDFPILVEATRRIDEVEDEVEDSAIGQALNMPIDEVRRGIRALERRDFVKTTETLDGSLTIDGAAGQAYLLAGLHPDSDDAADRLVSMLRQAAESTADPEEKRRLRRAASAIGDLVGEVGAGVMIAYATSFLHRQ